MEYKRVQTASCEGRNFSLADIRRMMSPLYIDYFIHPNKPPSIVSREVAMMVTGGDDSTIKVLLLLLWNSGAPLKLCVTWIAAQRKRRREHVITRSVSLGCWKGKTGEYGKPMWWSFDMSTTHGDETCRTQQEQMGDNGSASCARQGSHTPPFLLQAAFHPGEILRAKAYGSLFSRSADQRRTNERAGLGLSVRPMNWLRCSTPAGGSAVLEAPPEKRLRE